MQYIILIFFLYINIAFSFASDFFIDSVNGSNRNNGSKEKPWQSLQYIFDSHLVESQQWDSLPYKKGAELVKKNPDAVIKAGDTIWLLDGYYGGLFIRDYYNFSNITIAALEGHIPQFRSIHIQSGSKWTIRGLHVSPIFGDGKLPRDLIRIESHGFRGPANVITIEDCVIYSAQGTSKWSKGDWNNLTCNGISVSGERVTIRNNRIKNINFGISVSASHSLIENNIIENFAGDGLRGLGDYCVFQYNTIKNCYDVNDNHDDGFQSWSQTKDGVGKGQVVGIILRGNTIINYEDPDQPFRGTLQGIGCFDGMFVDWVIENNLVIVDHWHGITLLGARNCRIVNNTVTDLNSDKPGPPWIQIGSHKNGTESGDCIIRNNLAASICPAKGKNMIMDHNIIVADYDAVFNNADKFDLSLKNDCVAVDKGSPELAPANDILGNPRPQGKAVDVGAYELQQ